MSSLFHLSQFFFLFCSWQVSLSHTKFKSIHCRPFLLSATIANASSDEDVCFDNKDVILAASSAHFLFTQGINTPTKQIQHFLTCSVAFLNSPIWKYFIF